MYVHKGVIYVSPVFVNLCLWELMISSIVSTSTTVGRGEEECSLGVQLNVIVHVIVHV